ncbi:MAG: hypothetical protein M3336_03385, partial [Chloroflexota bacterium]|nr:hypothetical protein [Chloroflexota bacterium]
MHMDDASGGGERWDGRDRDSGGRGERIGIGGGDDAVTRIQLAARWAEAYAPEGNDKLGHILRRFRLAY